jgi:hypothetical protein
MNTKTKIPSRYTYWVVSEDEKFVAAKLPEENMDAGITSIYLYETQEKVIYPGKPSSLSPKPSLEASLRDLDTINRSITNSRFKIWFVNYAGDILFTQPKLESTPKFKVIQLRRSYDITTLSPSSTKKWLQKERKASINAKQQRLNKISSMLNVNSLTDEVITKLESVLST